MLTRRFKITVCLLVLLLLLPSVLLIAERIRGHISLGKYKRVLAAQGEKLTPKDLTVSVSALKNGAPTVTAATRQLVRGRALPSAYPPRMRLTPGGRAVVGFREASWTQDKVTYNWEQAAADLQTNAATLSRIREALAQPVLNNQLDYSRGFKVPFLHLAPAKSLTFWFGAASQLALHQGQPQQGLESLLAEIQLPRLLAEDRIVISELVRMAIGAVARVDTWEALQAEGWTEADLARLQQAWEAQHFAEAMARSLEGERVLGAGSYELLRSSHADVIAMIYGMQQIFQTEDSDRPWWERNLRLCPGGETVAEFLKKQVYCRLWRFAWLDQGERHYLERMQQLLTIARRAAMEKSLAGIQSDLVRFDQDNARQNWYDRLRYPDGNSTLTLSRTVGRALRAETERSLVLCALALKRYTLRHGQAPASLAALVPEFLTAVPVDYMDGQPVRYQLRPDGTFALYSVGENGKDDGGDLSRLPDRVSQRNLWDRKDFVWPAPAQADELETYRKEAAKE